MAGRGKKPFLIKGILLDFDGTITEPFFDWPAIKSEMGIGDMLILDAMAAATPERRAKLNEIMDRWERDAADYAIIRDGAVALLDALRTRGINAAVVTNNCTRNVEAVAARLSLNLPPIVSRDCGSYKPSLEFMKVALSVVGTPPEETAIAGDSVLDIRAGRAAGLCTIFLGREPVEITPDFRVSDSHALLELVLQLAAK